MSGSQRDHRKLEGVPILVVEDSPQNSRLVDILLSREGAIVRNAASAEDALQVLETFDARVIVLDLILPRMTGFGLLEKLRTQPATRDVVVIAVSVVDDPATQRRAMELGCAAYVRKPIDVHAFAGIVAAHIANEKDRP